MQRTRSPSPQSDPRSLPGNPTCSPACASRPIISAPFGPSQRRMANCQRRVFGGADRDRTGGLLVANQALSQLSYSPLFVVSLWSMVVSKICQRLTTSDRRLILVGLGRVELPTSPLSGVRSSHLSYRPGFTEFFTEGPEAHAIQLRVTSREPRANFGSCRPYSVCS